MPDIRPEDVTILIATGTHRVNTPAEHEQMLGADIARRYRIVNHDSRDAVDTRPRRHDDNRRARVAEPDWMDADIRITTGFVEPHFFAGFSGGPKMVAPGLAGLETVLVLHDARAHRAPERDLGRHRGKPDSRGRARDRADGARRFFRRRDAEPRAAHHRGLRRGSVRPSTGPRCVAAKRDAMRAVDAPFDVVLTTQLGLPARSESLSGGEGHVGGGQGRQAGRHDRLRRRMPRRPARRTAPTAQVLASQPSPAKLLDDDHRSRLLGAGSMAGAAAGATAVEGERDGEDERPDARRRSRRAFRTGRGCRDAVSTAMRAAGRDATLCVLPHGPQTIPYLR